MLRNDGKYTIFKIQMWMNPNSMYKEGKWYEPALDSMLNKAGWNVWGGDRREYLKDPYRSFSACGECWQETGENGSYSSDEALELLKLLARLYPDEKFRVARMEISQRTAGVFYYQPEDVIYADL
jgi:hypothetical protein